MKYYVIADPHGYYDLMMSALENSGFFRETRPCKLIVCGDLMDRGEGTLEMQRFMTELLSEDRLIYIRGNHEDLLVRLLSDLVGDYDLKRIENGDSYHVRNGTWDTALRLAGMTAEEALCCPEVLVRRVESTPFYTRLLPAAVNYFETEHYVFTHGYLPCLSLDGDTAFREYRQFRHDPHWREASDGDWFNARWYNGMRFACQMDLQLSDKTVVCGHWKCSYGHAFIEGKPREGDGSADYEPFYGKAREDADGRTVLIALDACTAVSGIVNCIALED